MLARCDTHFVQRIRCTGYARRLACCRQHAGPLHVAEWVRKWEEASRAFLTPGVLFEEWDSVFGP